MFMGTDGDILSCWDKDDNGPANISLLLGYCLLNLLEYPALKMTNFNVFNFSLSLERMVGLTGAGEEECGAPGAYLIFCVEKKLNQRLRMWRKK